MSTDIENMLKNGTAPDVQQLMAMLLNDPKDQIIVGDEVQFNEDPNDKRIKLPQGMGFKRTIEILERKHQEQEEPTQFSRTFKYRYHDGVYATTEVLKARYGLTLARGGFFSPAQTLEVQIARGKTDTCATGMVEIPTLADAAIYMGKTIDRHFGPVFQLEFGGPRKHMAEVKSFFDDVEAYLKAHSIYKGKSLTGASELEFIDPFVVDRRQVVFADEVTSQLTNLLFGPIRKTQDYRDEGIGIKRAILFHGPFGTGKTSIGLIAAQEVEATAGNEPRNRWTFLSASPDDKIEDVLRTARLYQPAVVLVEDIEKHGTDIKKLLEIFDGATSKGGEIVLAVTTNHIEKVEKGLLRPGRIDATVHVAELDRGGVERLIKVLVNPMKLANDVDFDAVFAQMTGFLPAFVKEAVGRAKTYALNAQGRDYVLDTAALAEAAMGMHDQLRQMQEAMESGEPPTIETAMKDLVTEAVVKVVDRTSVPDRDGDHGFQHLLVEAATKPSNR